MKLRNIFAAAALGATAFTAHAQVTVDGAWVRGTVAGQPSSGAFMTLKSARDARLVAASSPAAKTVEIHEMSMEGDVMKMRQISGLALPAGKAVELKPGGYHIMLMGLGEQLKEGQTVPLSLVVESAGKQETVQVRAPVKALTTPANPPMKEGMPMQHQGGMPMDHGAHGK